MMHNGFHIDTETSEGECLFIDAAGLTVAIRQEDDGLAVRVFPLFVADGPITSIRVPYSDAANEESTNTKEEL